MSKKLLLVSAGLFLCTLFDFFPALAAPNTDSHKIEYSNLSDKQFEALIQLKREFEKIEGFRKSEILSSEEALGARRYFLLDAGEKMGGGIEYERLTEMAEMCMQDVLCRKQTMFEKFKGIFSFVNIIWFLGSLLIAVGIIAVLIRHAEFIYRIVGPIIKLMGNILSMFVPAVVNMFKRIPNLIYELILYGIWFFSLSAAHRFSGADLRYSILVLSLLFLPLLVFSYKTHENYLDDLFAGKKNKSGDKNLAILFFTITFTVWGAISIYFSNSITGFMTVIVFSAWMGFMVRVRPLEYFIGFSSHDEMLRSTVSSFLLILLHLSVKIFHFSIPFYHLFETGVEYVGVFVFFSGLLIMSSKQVCGEMKGHFKIMQLITIASGFSALFLGSVYEMYVMRGIGGTFFALYLIEKFFEIPWGKKRFAWAILLFGILLYGLAQIVYKFPEYFFMR